MDFLKILLAETKRIQLEEMANANTPKPFHVMVNVTPKKEKMQVFETMICLN